MKTYIIYEGPSLLDGQPIVALAQIGSNNTKTGNQLQTYIFRADIDPLEASRSGEDFSICGNCTLRGVAHGGNEGQARDRACYVVLFQAPLGKYRAYKRGSYSRATDIAAIGRGKTVRIGSYGDGLAVPERIWDELCSEANGHTAYTHQKNTQPHRFMTSVESLGEAEQAWDRGERTFRVVKSVEQMVKGEVLCPASKEAGQRTTCVSCQLCAGNSKKGKSIAIVAHGNGGKKLRQRLETTNDLTQSDAHNRV